MEPYGSSQDDQSGQLLNRTPLMAGSLQKPARELKVEDALLYLDQVKLEFSDKPHIYNEFLDIMKNFKAQSINTPGVIDRVKNLFKGYNKLILGFNTFLPEGEGYKIELTAEEQAAPQEYSRAPTFEQQREELKRLSIIMREEEAKDARIAKKKQDRAEAAQAAAIQAGVQAQLAAMGVGVVGTVGGMEVPAPAPGMGTAVPSFTPMTAGPPMPSPGPNAPIPQPGQMQQAHAIHYVTKIRNRFANEPETYRSFLKILHTYQREQRGIKEVLEQVSSLFADHSDLLMEFTYFLPDAVQEQAKERLHRAARESDARKNARLAAAGTKVRRPYGSGTSAREEREREREQGQAKRARVDRANAAAGAAAEPRKARRKDETPRFSVFSKDISMNSERKFFEHVKEVLQGNGKEYWNEFIKILELFSYDLINYDNLLEMVSDLFPNDPNIVNDFKIILSRCSSHPANGITTDILVPLSEIDFSQCRKCTPSYRALPSSYPKPSTTERTAEEASVLNDTWVSIPIGSEESYSFKHMRKNMYEEALFKIEDERFEIDMMIDSNAATVRVLEGLAEEMRKLGQLGGAVGLGAVRGVVALDKRQLSTIHLNAIARLYGDTAEEVLELLRRCPASTIPVVLRRLKQKDIEWRKARGELNKTWKEIMLKNFSRSFDHRSFYFKVNDKKYCSTKLLVGEIVGKPPLPSDGHVECDLGMLTSLPDCQLAGLVPQMGLVYPGDSHLVHADIYSLLATSSEMGAGISIGDREKFSALYRDLIRVFFNLPTHYLYRGSGTPAAAGVAGESSQMPLGETYAIGSKVLTIYGSGTVVSYTAKMYGVRLAYGVGYLNETAIVGAEQLSPQALGAIGVTKDASGHDQIYSGQVPSASTNSSSSAASSNSSTALLIQDPCKIFYGTQMCYIFMRLHHTVYARLRIAKQLADEVQQQQSAGHHQHHHAAAVDVDGEDDHVQDAGADSKPTGNIYTHFLGALQSLLSGSMDSVRFEDFCRTLLGNRAYVLYSLDKIFVQMCKHIQAMVNDENVSKLIGIFLYHHNQQDRGVDSSIYQAHVAHILSHTMEDVFRIQLLAPLCATEGCSEVLIQHLGILSQSSSALPMAMDIVPEASVLARAASMDFAPKAVVSDDEDDEDDKMSTVPSVEDDHLDRKAVFSPRSASSSRLNKDY